MSVKIRYFINVGELMRAPMTQEIISKEFLIRPHVRVMVLFTSIFLPGLDK